MSGRETRDFEPTQNEIIKAGKLLRHFKGTLYKVSGFAVDANEDRMLVLYRHIARPEMTPWSRPLAEFYQEVKDDSGRWVRRFTVVEVVK